ncbi:MAG: hypothetical protein EOP62_04185 [Sphingomonadales bacterium]|nr:MAG: hypothetical protein EOP62_04185 [Sphingomonadales bacterium]
MSATEDTPRAVAEAMVAMIEAQSVRLVGESDRFTITIAGTTIRLDDGETHAFEKLASAIEARISYERATAMVAAAGETGIPLWLVVGPDMLGKWLAWSRTTQALVKVLSLTDRSDAAPVVGDLARRARRGLGQMAAKIRVRAGQAVAERIEFSHRVPATAVLGRRAIIRIAHQNVPDTLLIALKDPTRNERRQLAELVDHPFAAGYAFTVADVRREQDGIAIEVETAWGPLAPIPEKAWTAVPQDADPAFPWRPTAREVAELYGLAARGQHLLGKSN